MRVVAFVSQIALGFRSDLQSNLLLYQSLAHLVQFEIYDLFDLLSVQRVEDHRPIHAVEELGAKSALEFRHHLVLHPFVLFGVTLRVVT